MLNSSLHQPSRDIMGGPSVDSVPHGIRTGSITGGSPQYNFPDISQRQSSRHVYKQKGHSGVSGLNALTSGAAAIGARAPPGGLNGIQGSSLRARAPFLLHTDRAKQSDSTAVATIGHQTQKGGADNLDSGQQQMSVTGKKANGSEMMGSVGK